MLERFQKTKQAIRSTEASYNMNLTEQRRLFNRQVERSRRLHGGGKTGDADGAKSASGKKRKMEPAADGSSKKQKSDKDGASLKSILHIPDLSNELKRAIGKDVRPINEIRDPALFVHVQYDYDECGDDMWENHQGLHRIQLSSEPNTYIVSKHVLRMNPPGAYTMNESLSNVVIDLLSKEKNTYSLNIEYDDDVENFCVETFKIQFLFSERRPEEDIHSFSDEDIRRRLRILTSINLWSFKISSDHFYVDSNGERRLNNKEARYEAGQFFPTELDVAYRMFNPMHYDEIIYYENRHYLDNEAHTKDITHILEDVTETFDALVQGKLRLRPQKLPDPPGQV